MEECEVIQKWEDRDTKMRTQIELAIGNLEMIHIIGACTASKMWRQLMLVKESRGKLGVLAT
jgi:hypothetical protein